MIAWFPMLASAQEPPAPAPEPVPEPVPQPAPAPEPDSVELHAEEPVPSAIDALDAAKTELALENTLPDWVPLPGQLVRGKLFVRPVLGYESVAAHGGAVRLGGAFGHRWWTLAPTKVSVGGEERLEASAPVGAQKGRRVSLAVAAGPWFGPVGFRLGPVGAWERAEWSDGAVLDDAVLIGAGADLSLDLSLVALSVGVEPVWGVSGARGSAAAFATFPVIGHETTWRSGVAWLGRPLQLFLDGEARETQVGTVFSAAVGFHVKVL